MHPPWPARRTSALALASITAAQGCGPATLQSVTDHVVLRDPRALTVAPADGGVTEAGLVASGTFTTTEGSETNWALRAAQNARGLPALRWDTPVQLMEGVEIALVSTDATLAVAEVATPRPTPRWTTHDGRFLLDRCASLEDVRIGGYFGHVRIPMHHIGYRGRLSDACPTTPVAAAGVQVETPWSNITEIRRTETWSPTGLVDTLLASGGLSLVIGGLILAFTPLATGTARTAVISIGLTGIGYWMASGIALAFVSHTHEVTVTLPLPAP